MTAHLDLFSGIGGFALAARWAGFETVQFVEIDKFCHRVLNKNFPGVPIHADIKTFTYPSIANDGGYFGEPEERSTPKFGGNFEQGTVKRRPFLLTGGFPCQPFSCAGKRKGNDDSRALFPEMLRVIQEARPRWVIGENVGGFVNMGLDDCVSSLEAEGYEVQPLIIPACAVGAPHRRDRVWIVGHSEGSSIREVSSICERESTDGTRGNQGFVAHSKGNGLGKWGLAQHDNKAGQPFGSYVDAADTKSQQAYAPESGGLHAESCGKDSDAKNPFSGGMRRGGDGTTRRRECSLQIEGSSRWSEPWIEAATRLCSLDARLPGGLVRPKGWRVNALKALGNSVVPQIPYLIMKGIIEVEKELATNNKP